MTTLKFELTIEETNVVMASLGRMPYDQVFNLVTKLQQQATPQLQQQPQTVPASDLKDK
jgi:hypothetical protein